MSGVSLEALLGPLFGDMEIHPCNFLCWAWEIYWNLVKNSDWEPGTNLILRTWEPSGTIYMLYILPRTFKIARQQASRVGILRGSWSAFHVYPVFVCGKFPLNKMFFWGDTYFVHFSGIGLQTQQLQKDILMLHHHLQPDPSGLQSHAGEALYTERPSGSLSFEIPTFWSLFH